MELRQARKVHDKYRKGIPTAVTQNRDMRGNLQKLWGLVHRRQRQLVLSLLDILPVWRLTGEACSIGPFVVPDMVRKPLTLSSSNLLHSGQANEPVSTLLTAMRHVKIRRPIPPWVVAAPATETVEAASPNVPVPYVHTIPPGFAADEVPAPHPDRITTDALTAVALVLQVRICRWSCGTKVDFMRYLVPGGLLEIDLIL